MAAFVWWNARGVKNKAPVLKELLEEKGAVYCGVSESQTYNDSAVLGCKRWKWQGGAETTPTMGSSNTPRGLGAFTDRDLTSSSLVHTGKYSAWHRVEIDSGMAAGVGQHLSEGGGEHMMGRRRGWWWRSR